MVGSSSRKRHQPILASSATYIVRPQFPSRLGRSGPAGAKLRSSPSSHPRRHRPTASILFRLPYSLWEFHAQALFEFGAVIFAPSWIALRFPRVRFRSLFDNFAGNKRKGCRQGSNCRNPPRASPPTNPRSFARE